MYPLMAVLRLAWPHRTGHRWTFLDFLYVNLDVIVQGQQPGTDQAGRCEVVPID